jgi:FlaA1/EpsC-like NDP-sugar epimerase
VPIQITGLRPGEKLHEQLFYEAEQIHSTEVPKVLRAVGDGIPYDIHLRAARILEAATGARDAELRIALFDLVESLSSAPATPIRPTLVADISLPRDVVELEPAVTASAS